MTPAGPPEARDRIRSFYRWLLSAYPRSFRDRYQADLLQAFDDRRTEARFSGTVGGVRLVLFLLRGHAVEHSLGKHGVEQILGRRILRSGLEVRPGTLVTGWSRATQGKQQGHPQD